MGRRGASSGPLRGVSGRLGSVLGASWGLLGSVLGRLAMENRLGAVLEPSWKRLGGVLGMSWAVLEASRGRLVALFEVSWAVLERLGASWRHLVRDFQTKKWLHVSLASEIPFFNGFLLYLSSNFDLQNYVKYDSRLGKTY